MNETKDCMRIIIIILVLMSLFQTGYAIVSYKRSTKELKKDIINILNDTIASGGEEKYMETLIYMKNETDHVKRILIKLTDSFAEGKRNDIAMFGINSIGSLILAIVMIKERKEYPELGYSCAFAWLFCFASIIIPIIDLICYTHYISDIKQCIFIYGNNISELIKNL